MLGGLLLDNSAWDRVSDVLSESDFYKFEHRLIYASIQTLIGGLRPADVIEARARGLKKMLKC